MSRGAHNLLVQLFPRLSSSASVLETAAATTEDNAVTSALLSGKFPRFPLDPPIDIPALATN